MFVLYTRKPAHKYHLLPPLYPGRPHEASWLLHHTRRQYWNHRKLSRWFLHGSVPTPHPHQQEAYSRQSPWRTKAREADGFPSQRLIISADPLRDFRNNYVAILHPAPYDLVYLIHNFNPILSLLQKIFSPVYKSFDRFYHLPLLSLRYFRLGKPSAHDASLKPPQQASLYHPLCFVYSEIHNPAVNTKIILPYALSFFNHNFCKYKISSIHAVFLLFIN